jgi:hypothetical protein
MDAIAANGLRKSYGDKVVLDSVDLAVPEGTIFALVAWCVGLACSATSGRPRRSTATRSSRQDSAVACPKAGAVGGAGRSGHGLTARMIAACMPGAASCVKVTEASTKPTAASPSRYSRRLSAPAMQPT